MKNFYYTLIIFAFSLSITAQTTPTGSSTEVGITEGQLSVSLTGGATYSVPIAVPPGINGVVPQVGLVYNSQGGNGVAGYGWNISGVSAITRIPSTKFHDGTIDPVDFDALDRFAFNGQRLILKSGTYGSAGAIYETENFSNVKITSYGIHPNGANYGPSYFVVEYPDGSKAQYGNSSDSKSIIDWEITYWENPQGVRISYSYISSNNSLSIEYIKYGSIATGMPINQVKFVYKTRLRPEQAYIGGQSIVKNNILSEVQVMGNGVGFRNYALNYGPLPSIEYEKLQSITEKSGDGSKSYNPTVFRYDNTDQITSYNTSTANFDITNLSYINTKAISGDFNGDAKMDFILTELGGLRYTIYDNIINGTVINGLKQNSSSYSQIFASNSITGDEISGYKLLPKQTWTLVNSNGTSFKTYTKELDNTINLVSERNVEYQLRPSYYCELNNETRNCDLLEQNIDTAKQILNGDFNGDGITDVIAIENVTVGSCTECTGAYDEYANYMCTPTGNSFARYDSVYFINLDKRETDYFKWIGSLNIPVYCTYQVIDFNGDGKSDIMAIQDKKVSVYTINDSYQLVLLYASPTDADVVTSRPVLTGDYNGDGKTDFIIPKGYGKNYAKYLSTGNTFLKQDFTYEINYYQNDANNIYYIIPNDLNNDGKTDLILAKTSSTSSSGSITFDFYCNKSSGFYFESSSSTGTQSSIKANPIPIFLSSYLPTRDLQICFISNNKIHSFQSQKNFSKELLNSIRTGNGVQEFITYSPLINDLCTNNCHPVYKASEGVENYPNIDISNALSFQVVSKLENFSDKVYKKQLYAYNGAVSNVDGLGFLGFRSTMRTNWHDDSSASSIISSISKFDMTQRGANIENYTVLNLHDPLTTAPGNQTTRIITKEGDYTVTGTENLIATQRITLKPNTWIQPGSTFSAKIAPEANASSNTPIDFITKSILTYESDLLANKVFKIQNTVSKQYNALENTNSETTTVYDTYNNPTQSTTLLKEGGTTVQTTVANVAYDNQPTASPYYIGRPTNKTQSVAVTGDTMTSEEQYGYTNHLLTQIKKKGNNTDFITEDNSYDTFGNITKKTITATGLAPRVTNYVYDTSGRFLTKSSDIETLTTTFDYNLSSGVLNFEINPYGLKTTYEYDSWFKKTKTIDYLGKSNNYVYARNGSVNTFVTTTGDDGSVSQEFFDDLGRKTTSRVKDLTGIMSNVDYYYDIYDRNIKVSEPYNGGSSSEFNTTEYDVYGRVFKSTSSTGKIVDITYSGLTTTVNDGSKTKKSTKNAIGKVVAMTDTPGGTINYTYFANGNLKSSNYDGVTTTIEQDGWGRKTKLTDSSAGIYSYTYNGFGETTEEKTPNGITEYSLDDFGKLKKKTISGTNTNSVSDYVYDGASKLLLSSTFNDIKEGTLTNYKYTYDSSKRITTTEEETPFYGTKFTKLVSYDLFGRVEYETSTAAIGGKSSAKKIKNVYKNGSSWQIIDDATQLVLWQTNTVNARGQITEASLGNGINITNTYDQYGFAKEFKHDKTGGTPVNVMTLTTVFDPQKGNLTSRTNSLFNWNETFKYDSLDRLTTFTNELSQEEIQAYDNRGRITQNNLGTYNYNYGSKPYQNSSIDLKPLSVPYYKGRPTLNITYNTFKSPVQIDEAGKDKINFIYNDNNSRSAMFYGSMDDDKLKRPNRKYYSADDTMEIKHNIVSGALEFVTYIGGDGYSAPIVLKSDGTTQNYLYLHRDYQGSILAITDADGAVLEKRLFDAWGSIIKVQNGAGVTLTGLTILDRGYTGHEHLQSLRIINMNGRIYDPKLHRFLQPDNNVQDLFNTQNYNRYGYVLNNPLKYTDPSGESWWSDNWKQVATMAAVVVVSVAVTIATAGMGSPLAAAMITGAAAGFTGGALGTALNGGSLGQSLLSGLKGAAIGGAMAGIGYGVSLMAPAGAFAGASYGGTTGFVLGGFASELSGGDFMDGAINGAVFGMIGGGIQGFNSAEARGLNPWTGAPKSNVIGLKLNGSSQAAQVAYDKSTRVQAKPIGMGEMATQDQVAGFAKENNFFSGQKTLGDKSIVEGYLNKMNEGTFDAKSGAAGFEYKGKTIFTDGNHRMNAAIQFKLNTGSSQYIYSLKINGNFTQANPSQYGYKTFSFPTFK
jgi:RHS repeat-associated protein